MLQAAGIFCCCRLLQSLPYPGTTADVLGLHWHAEGIKRLKLSQRRSDAVLDSLLQAHNEWEPRTPVASPARRSGQSVGIKLVPMAVSSNDSTPRMVRLPEIYALLRFSQRVIL